MVSRKSGPASLKMDVINETNYNMSTLDPARANAMTPDEATNYLDELRRQGKIPAYRDYYLLRDLIDRPALADRPRPNEK